MDVEQYYNMCEMMGVEPKDEDLPRTFAELPLEVQEAYNIFSVLPPRIAEFSGTYLGRDFGTLSFLLDIYRIEESWKPFYFKLLMLIDRVTTSLYQRDSKKKETKK